MFVKELRHPALPFSALRCLQQRNEIMQSFLRFVNRSQQSFLLPPAPPTALRQPSGRPRNPCRACLAGAALCCEGANSKRVRGGWQAVSEPRRKSARMRRLRRFWPQARLLIKWPFRPAGPLFDEMGTFDDYPSDMEAQPGQQHLPADQRRRGVAGRSRCFRRG
ncbi:hypothetical protein CT19431_MP40041 [Cupriavidus taiwanensis]|nr:hypothetical protein CT19431_MP40041 [Cupriavidus taiwanensis]